MSRRPGPVATCRSCTEVICWVMTEAGNKMPLDPDPVEGGNVLLVAGRGGAGVIARVVTPAEAKAAGGKLHRSHFATCPKADQHRRPRP